MDKRKSVPQGRLPLFRAMGLHVSLPVNSLIEIAKHKIKPRIKTLTSKFETATLRVSFFIREISPAQTIQNIVDVMQAGLTDRFVCTHPGIQGWALERITDHTAGYSTVSMMANHSRYGYMTGRGGSPKIYLIA